MTGRSMSPELHQQVQATIHEAYYSARVLGMSHAQAAGNAASALMPVIASVDENAHGRGEVEALTKLLARARELRARGAGYAVDLIQEELRGRRVE